mmetsp:Transcript_94739/g.240948  ORF Transcript_94739/g.240948 Transcript_94739/m.240948 type:complete len:536 (+) Transcript_94739:842-2449(+)
MRLGMVVASLHELENLVVGTTAVAEITAVVAGLQLDDPDALARGATVLLDDAGLEGHGLLEASRELIFRVVGQGILQADVQVRHLHQGILGAHLLHDIGRGPNLDAQLPQLPHGAVEFHLVPAVGLDLTRIASDDDRLELLADLQERVMLLFDVVNELATHACVDHPVCDRDGVVAVAARALVRAPEGLAADIDLHQGCCRNRIDGLRKQPSVVLRNPRETRDVHGAGRREGLRPLDFEGHALQVLRPLQLVHHCLRLLDTVDSEDAVEWLQLVECRAVGFEARDCDLGLCLIVIQVEAQSPTFGVNLDRRLNARPDDHLSIAGLLHRLLNGLFANATVDGRNIVTKLNLEMLGRCRVVLRDGSTLCDLADLHERQRGVQLDPQGLRQSHDEGRRGRHLLRVLAGGPRDADLQVWLAPLGFLEQDFAVEARLLEGGRRESDDAENVEGNGVLVQDFENQVLALFVSRHLEFAVPHWIQIPGFDVSLHLGLHSVGNLNHDVGIRLSHEVRFPKPEGIRDLHRECHGLRWYRRACRL